MKLEGKLFFDALIASFKSAVGFRKQLNTLNAKAEAAGNGGRHALLLAFFVHNVRAQVPYFHSSYIYHGIIAVFVYMICHHSRRQVFHFPLTIKSLKYLFFPFDLV
jgi:hypothetical protein